VFLKDIRLCPVVMSIKFGNVVYLDIVPDTVSEAIESVTFTWTVAEQRDLHAMSSGSITIILPSREIVGIMEFEFLLKR
jgi:hypothetical protein